MEWRPYPVPTTTGWGQVSNSSAGGNFIGVDVSQPARVIPLNYRYTGTTFTGDGSADLARLLEKQPQERIGGKVRYLFRITVVNPKTDMIVWEGKVVATSKADAGMKADLPAEVRKNVDAYDILTEQVPGEIRAKRETQKVVIAKEGEE